MSLRLCLSRLVFAALLLPAPAMARAAAAPPASSPDPPPPMDPEAPMSGGASTLAPINPHDTCRKQPLDARFRITLEREAQLVDLVRWMSSITCTKFIWSPGVRDGKVTVVAPEPVTIQQAYAAFYAALETMGLTVERSGDYFKVVESKDPNRQVVPVYRPGEAAPARDRFVTQMVRPHPGRVNDVVAVVEHLKGARGAVQAVGDLVVITDTGSNVARMMTVIDEVDQPVRGEQDAIFLHPLQHADPEELAPIIQEVFMSGAAPPRGGGQDAKVRTKAKPKAPRATTAPTTLAESTTPARITALAVDARTRTLVITAAREDFPVVRRFIDRLDVPVPDDAGTLFVLPLRHADPEEVAQVLGRLPAGERAGTGAGAGSGSPPSSPAGGAGVSIGGEIHITADPATRSLVVMASHRDYLALKRVVDALDVERRQVYIEAYILELSTRSTVGAGLSGQLLRANDDGSMSLLSSGTNDGALLNTELLSGLAAGLIGPTIPGSEALFGRDIPSFGVVIQALETRNDVNIVADPHLYTADNKTAKMEVGQKVPIPTGNNSFATGTGQLSQITYDRQEVSLSMEVTPHIGDGESLTLDISIENEEIASEDEVRGPTTTNRRLELEDVLARDGQPVVLGGLVQEKETLTTRQVPRLGSIPVIGWLFKNRTRTREKVNLLVVLIPHVLESPEDARQIHMRRIRERREFLERETAFERRDLQAHINYGRKSGLLSSVNAEAAHMSAELDFKRHAQAQLRQTVAATIAPEGTYELGSDPDEGSAAAAPAP